MKIGIFYGSTTGNTEAAAKSLASKLGADVYDISSNPISKVVDYSLVILGTSTWGMGDLQDDWDAIIDDIGDLDLKDKAIALFGTGDGSGYGDSFVDGIGTIYNKIKDTGCKVVGFTDMDSYDFDESTAVDGDKFVGLPLDEENQGHMTEERISNWASQIKEESKEVLA